VKFYVYGSTLIAHSMLAGGFAWTVIHMIQKVGYRFLAFTVADIVIVPVS
jgi:hypothetical protein